MIRPMACSRERRAISFFLGERPMGRMDDVPPMYLTMRWGSRTPICWRRRGLQAQ